MSGGAPNRTQAAPTPATKAQQVRETARERGTFDAARGWSPPAADPPRLRVGRANDPCEAEADAAAERALAEPAKDAAPLLGARPGAAGILRAKTSSGGSPAAPPGLDRQIAAAAGEGRVLAGEQRDFFKPRFNHDFASVRVHAGLSAAKAAKEAGAQAFTLGDNIFFGAGEYRPESETGRRLLAHELAHTLQDRPNVIARRALPSTNDLPDAGPAQPGAEAAASELADAPEGGEELARERLKGLDPLTRTQALARMRARLPAGEADKASALARKEAEKPETAAAPPLPAQAGGGGDDKKATPGERERGVETRAEPTAPAPVENVAGAPTATPAPAHERASASAASKMQEAIRTVSGEVETGSADAQLAVAPDAPAGEGGGGAPAPQGGAAAAAQSAIAALSGRLAELQEAKSLPVHFQEDGGPPGDPVAFARQRESAGLAAAFIERAAAKIETVIAAALATPAAALTALDAARAAITGQVAAQGAAISDDADKARKNINGQAGRVRSAIDAKRAGADSAAAADIKAARDRARTARDTASTGIGKRAETEKGRISTSYVDAAPLMAAVGDDAAKKAAAAADEWKKKLPPYETDWSILDGPYENDRIDGKKEAVDKLAADYGKSFQASARDQAGKIPASKPEVLGKVDDVTRQAGAGLTTQLEQIDQGASAQEKGAKAQSKQSAQKTKAALGSSAAQNLAALDAAEKQQGSALTAQGAGAEDSLDKSTAAGISGLADGASQATGELIGSIRSFVDSVAETPVPEREDLAAALDEANSNVEGPVGAMATQIASVAPSLAQTSAAVSEQGADSLKATAAAARQGFEDVATSFATSASGVSQQAAQGFRAISKSNRKAADGIGARAEAGFLEAAKNASETYENFGDIVEDNFRVGREQMLAGLWSKETQFNLNKGMDDSAKQVDAEVQPRWKKWAKRLIMVLVIVAVILITVASAAVLGPVGIILLGAVLGAAAGAVETIADNLIDNKPWSEGVVKAVIVGAIGGLAGGAGGVLLKGVGTLAIKIGLEAGINVAGGFTGEVVGSLAVHQTVDWTGALKGALWGAAIGVGIGIAGAAKGKIKIGGKSAGAPAPHPTIEPPPPAPAGKLRSFLEQTKVLAPRPGAPVPEVNVGAGAGGGEPAPRTPGATTEPAPAPATAEPAAASAAAPESPAATPTGVSEPAPASSSGSKPSSAPEIGAKTPTGEAPATTKEPRLGAAETVEPGPSQLQAPEPPLPDNVRPIGSAEPGFAGEQPRLRSQRPTTTAEDFAARARARDTARAVPDRPPTEPQFQRKPVAEAAGAEGQAPQPGALPDQPKLRFVEGGGQGPKPGSFSTPHEPVGPRAGGRSTLEPRASAGPGGGGNGPRVGGAEAIEPTPKAGAGSEKTLQPTRRPAPRRPPADLPEYPQFPESVGSRKPSEALKFFQDNAAKYPKSIQKAINNARPGSAADVEGIDRLIRNAQTARANKALGYDPVSTRVQTGVDPAGRPILEPSSPFTSSTKGHTPKVAGTEFERGATLSAKGEPKNLTFEGQTKTGERIQIDDFDFRTRSGKEIKMPLAIAEDPRFFQRNFAKIVDQMRRQAQFVKDWNFTQYVWEMYTPEDARAAARALRQLAEDSPVLADKIKITSIH